MIRRILSLMMVLILCACCVPAMADDGYAGQSYSGSTLLSSLTHNCPNTGIMLPSAFSP